MNKTKFFSSLLVGLLVTTGLFTSCKDYDDDIKNLQQQIDQKSLKTDLESLKSSLETRLATLESTLNTKEAALKAEIAKKANQTDLDALTTVVNGKANQSALDAEIAARVQAVVDLTAEIDGINAELNLTFNEDAEKQEANKATLNTLLTWAPVENPGSRMPTAFSFSTMSRTAYS